MKGEFSREQVNTNIDYIDVDNNHAQLIENLFKEDVSMIKIQNIIKAKFLLATQDVMTQYTALDSPEVMIQDAVTVFFPQNEYSLP